jgi:hypothetical protein
MPEPPKRPKRKPYVPLQRYLTGKWTSGNVRYMKKTVKVDADLHSQVKVRVAPDGTVEEFVKRALVHWLVLTRRPVLRKRGAGR